MLSDTQAGRLAALLRPAVAIRCQQRHRGYGAGYLARKSGIIGKQPPGAPGLLKSLPEIADKLVKGVHAQGPVLGAQSERGPLKQRKVEFYP